MRGGICLGGTFNTIHEGHMSMLRLAFRLGGRVYIGLTSDAMAAGSRSAVIPYARRLAALRRACSRLGRDYEIMMLDEPYGYSTRIRKLSGIVVSEATAFRVEEINEIRSGMGYQALKAHVVPLIRSFNGLPLSSTRVIAGDCDRKGRLTRRLRVGIGSSNRNKSGAVRDVFRLYRREIGDTVFRTCSPDSGVPEQPFEKETVAGAAARAMAAAEGNDLGIGIEAGLFRSEELHAVFDVQYCVILDRAGRMTSGHGMGFAYPPAVLDGVARGMSVGEIMSKITGIDGIGARGGAIGYLSRGRMNRRELTRQAVISALLPRLNPQLYTSLPGSAGPFAEVKR